jgi:hypothetical protein
MSSKICSDEQLEEMGSRVTLMRDHTVEIWRIGMKALLISSPEYKLICTQGTKVQDLHFKLREMAVEREWPRERLDKVFGPQHYTAFS